MVNSEEEKTSQKVIFIGSGEFAIPILDKLIKSPNFEVLSIITQPDKPVGRKQNLEPTAIAKYCLKSNVEIPIQKPEKISLIYEFVKNLNSELIVVASYGQIIPEKILKLPKIASVNFHGSLLPKLRGAIPIQTSILLGFEETGVTLQKMIYEMDAGEIISQRRTKITKNDTSESLMQRLSIIAADMVENELLAFCFGEIVPTPQDHTKATFCYKDQLKKENAKITFDTDLEKVDRMVRAFYPWPVAWLEIDNKIIKIFKTGEFILGRQNDRLCFIKKDKKLYLNLASGLIEVTELQLEGKNRDLFKNYFFLTNF